MLYKFIQAFQMVLMSFKTFQVFPFLSKYLPKIFAQKHKTATEIAKFFCESAA